MDAPCTGVECAKMEVLLTPQQGTPMSEITVIGLDLAKHVFQVHGADPDGRPVLRRRLRRGQVLEFFATLSPCLIGMEACAGSHYWGRELQALGHEVRLIPPQYVKPCVKTNKNDAIDAEAISEALTRPTMRFTTVKSAEQQSVLMLHRTRELLVATHDAGQCAARALRRVRHRCCPRIVPRQRPDQADRGSCRHCSARSGAPGAAVPDLSDPSDPGTDRPDREEAPRLAFLL